MLGKRNNLFLLIILLSVHHLSCDFEKPINRNVDQLFYFPMYTHEQIELPVSMIQSPDTMAQLAVKLVEFANSLKYYADFLFVPFDSIDIGLPYTIQWLDDGNVINRVTISASDDERQFEWKLTKDGTDKITGKTYDKWLFIKAIMETENRSCQLIIYDENNGQMWANVIHTSMSSEEPLYYAVRTWLDSLVNYFSINHWDNFYLTANDFSYNNSLYFDIDTLFYHIVWNKEGQGTWSAMNEENEIILRGAWD